MQKFFSLSVLFCFSLILLSCGGTSKINTDSKAHQQTILDSKINNDVRVSLDTVFYKGEPWGILKTDGFSFATLYHFYTLTGEPTFDITPYSAGEGGSTSHHEYSFHGTSEGMKAYVPFSFSKMSVIEAAVNNNLMATTGLKPLDVDNFVRKNPRPSTFNPGLLKVRRETTRAVEVRMGDKDIFQDGKRIGYYTENLSRTPDLKQSTYIFKVLFIDNKTVAATVKYGGDKFQREAEKLMEIHTEFDNKIHRIQIDPANYQWDQDAFKQAANFLVKNGYL